MKLIDVHMYFGKWGFPIQAISTEGIIALMDKMGIEKAILMSALGISYDLVGGNAILAAEIEPWDRLYGYVYVNGNYIQESLREMEKYLPGDKFVGVKFQPECSGAAPNDPSCDIMWDVVEKKYRKPVLIHSWTLPEHGNAIPYSLPEYSLEVARSHPELKIVLGHMGGIGWRDCLKVARKADNLWVDFCCSYADRDKIEVAVDELGAERVLFGSAMTENNGWMQIGALSEAAIGAADRHRIAYENAARLFGI